MKLSAVVSFYQQSEGDLAGLYLVSSEDIYWGARSLSDLKVSKQILNFILDLTGSQSSASSLVLRGLSSSSALAWLHYFVGAVVFFNTVRYSHKQTIQIVKFGHPQLPDESIIKIHAESRTPLGF